MKFALCSIGGRDWPIRDVIGLASECGYEGVELWEPHVTQFVKEGGDVGALREGMLALGITPTGLSSYGVFVQLDEDRERTLSRFAEETLPAAVKLGGVPIRMMSDWTGSAAQTEVGFKLIATGLAEMARLAAPQGVGLLLETHGDQLTDTTASTLRLLEAIGEPNVRVTLDVFNLYAAGEDPLEALSTLLPLTDNVHLKNGRISGDKWDYSVALGEGLMDFVPFVRELREKGYGGYAAVEWFKEDGSEGDFAEAARREAHWLRMLLGDGAGGKRSAREVEAGETAAAAAEAINLLPALRSQTWRTWTPRAALAPEFARLAGPDDDALAIRSPGNAAAYGSWRNESGEIRPGATYAFRFAYTQSKVVSEAVSINVIVSWLDEAGQWLRRDYVDERLGGRGESRGLARILTAPAGARIATVELEQRWTEHGVVEWSTAEMTELASVGARPVRLVTTHFVPTRVGEGQLAFNLNKILAVIDQAAERKPDLICLTENLYNCCSSQTPEELAQPIPGPLTQAVGERAARAGAYVVFNMTELDGELLYITSVLLDRSGQIVGKYRKSHLPLIEAQHGITPGSDYPVFDTDFGKVGLLICWDQKFADPARLLRERGAEIVCISTAGEGRTQQITRAVDNGLYLVVAGTNAELITGEDGVVRAEEHAKPSRIVAPDGSVRCEIGPGDGGIGVADVDLNASFYQYWLSVGPAFGEMRSLYVRERRPDLYAAQD